MTATAQLLDELRTHSVRGINRRVDWMFDAAATEIERLQTQLAEAQMHLVHAHTLMTARWEGKAESELLDPYCKECIAADEYVRAINHTVLSGTDNG